MLLLPVCIILLLVQSTNAFTIHLVNESVGPTWSQARALCQGLGSDLASITSQDDQDAINLIFPDPPPENNAFCSLWIGLNDIENERFGNKTTGWVWADGTPFTFEKFASTEPNNGGGSFQEDCVALSGKNFNNDWNDFPCSTKTCGYVCGPVTSTPSPTTSNPEAFDIMQYIPYIAGGGGALLFLAFAFYCCCRHRRNKQNSVTSIQINRISSKGEENEKKNGRIMALSVSSSIGGGGGGGQSLKYLAFLSHYKEEASPIACMLKKEINARSKFAKKYKLSCFLDSDELNDLGTIGENVKRSGVLLCILSPKYLTRPWCLYEIYTAATNNVPIDVVLLKSTNFGQDVSKFINEFSKENLDQISPNASATLEKNGVDLSKLQDILQNKFIKIKGEEYNPNDKTSHQNVAFDEITKRVEMAIHG